MKKIIISLLIIAIIGVAFWYLYDEDYFSLETVKEDSWTFELYGFTGLSKEFGNFTRITFTQEMLDMVQSDVPEVVFENIMIEDPELNVLLYQTQDGVRKSWFSESDDNDLIHIEPDNPVTVSVSADCILVIDNHVSKEV